MSVSLIVDTLIKRRDIYKRKITSALNSINTSENLVKNSFLVQKQLVMNWLSSLSYMNEKTLNAFIDSEVDAEIIDKGSEQEVSFSLFILNKLVVCEKFINGSGGVKPSGKVKQPCIQYEMAPKLKCPV